MSLCSEIEFMKEVRISNGEKPNALIIPYFMLNHLYKELGIKDKKISELAQISGLKLITVLHKDRSYIDVVEVLEYKNNERT